MNLADTGSWIPLLSSFLVDHLSEADIYNIIETIMLCTMRGTSTINVVNFSCMSMLLVFERRTGI